MIEVWIGTPNQMAKATGKATQPAAVKWARDYLAGLKAQAWKYDNAVIDDIQRVSDELRSISHLVLGETRDWQFPYTSITFRIELRRPTK